MQRTGLCPPSEILSVRGEVVAWSHDNFATSLIPGCTLALQARGQRESAHPMFGLFPEGGGRCFFPPGPGWGGSGAGVSAAESHTRAKPKALLTCPVLSSSPSPCLPS